jgi:hypothetical protein
MTTTCTIRNTSIGDTASSSPRLSGVARPRRRGHVELLGGWKATLRGLSKFKRVLPYLVGESDDFESRNRLNWWSYGAFARKGQLYGNQYLAGRRAPPLLHQ